jgi:hypothetical protein
LIKKIIKTIGLMGLVIGFVSLASGNSTQSISVPQEFDDDAKPVTQAASPQQQAIQKQHVVATAAKPEPQASQVAATDQKKPSGEGGLREVLSSLLPSKQDLDKAFDEVSNQAGPPRPTNWRDSGQ